MGPHCFTSITANYLPKARVLARSLKQHQENVVFHLLLCDQIPDFLKLEAEPFDSIISIDQLPIADQQSWIFKHSRVELCTAVKGFGFNYLLEHTAADYLFYFDPDIVVFNAIDALCLRLQQADILLTPHQTEPEQEKQAVIDNEICSLKHGIYNLGFLGIKRSANSQRFLQWWQQRLYDFCYDEIPGGLFTDQRWIDLAPVFFAGVEIVRDPIYNVATWNLTHRHASGSLDSGIMINDQPLCFFHFSGIDSGEQKIMLKKYMGANPVLLQLHHWYLQQCRAMDQEVLGELPCIYSTYNNGEPVTEHQRRLYRLREDLQRAFPEPFRANNQQHSYYHWYLANVPEAEQQGGGQQDTRESLMMALSQSRSELDAIKSSKSWKLMLFLQRIYKLFN